MLNKLGAAYSIAYFHFFIPYTIMTEFKKSFPEPLLTVYFLNTD